MAVSAVLIDIDGVLVVSWHAVPGAVEAMASLRRTRIPLRLVTNTTSHTRSWMATRLSAQGFPVHPEDVLTAPGLTARYLAEHHHGARCAVLSSGDLGGDLPGITVVPVADPDVDVVVLGGAGPEFDYASLVHAFHHVRSGAELVAMNRNLYWATDDGLALDTGAFLAGLEAATGVTATMTGKPSPAFFEAALADAGADPATTVVVGDDVTSDVRAAQALGMTGVLVRTGKFTPADLEGDVPPDHVIDSVADLPALLEKLAAG